MPIVLFNSHSTVAAVTHADAALVVGSVGQPQSAERNGTLADANT